MIKLVKDILAVFGKHGLFDEGVALIGSWCFQLYQKHYRVEKFPLQTQDIDFLTPTRLKAKNMKSSLMILSLKDFMWATTPTARSSAK